MKVGQSREDVLYCSKWIIGISQIVTRLRLIRSPSLVGDITVLKILVSLSDDMVSAR